MELWQGGAAALATQTADSYLRQWAVQLVVHRQASNVNIEQVIREAQALVAYVEKGVDP